MQGRLCGPRMWKEDRTTASEWQRRGTAACNLQLSLVHVPRPTKAPAFSIGRVLIKNLLAVHHSFAPLPHRRLWDFKFSLSLVHTHLPAPPLPVLPTYV